MTAHFFSELGLYLGVLVALAYPLGSYMSRVYEGDARLVRRALGWLERLSYRVARIDPHEEMGWVRYLAALLTFNLVGGLTVYALQAVQGVLPLNPLRLPPVSAPVAFNTAVSFAS